MTVSDDLTATSGTISVNADNDANGSGTFTVASGKTVATVTSGVIDITAADVDLVGSLNSVSTVSITASNNRTIGLGADGWESDDQ